MNTVSLQGLSGLQRSQTAQAQVQRTTGSGDFAQLLRAKVEGLRFSAHAETRMKSRNITMTPEMMGKLNKAVADAAGKGSRDSLIMLKDLAFIVNVPSRTVVTAMDGESIRDNIFTNIDSAVIAG